jgi:diamine N-acetyltransferase
VKEQFVIRNAVTADVPLLQMLGRKTFSDTFADFNTAENMNMYLDKNFATDKINQELHEPAAEFMLIYDGDACAGFARIRKGNQTDGVAGRAMEIERLYVVKEYIGKNVGALLMEECLRRAADGGFEVVWLGVWEHNARAIRFYEKFGFVKFSDHVFMLGDDAQTDWLMKKVL